MGTIMNEALGRKSVQKFLKANPSIANRAKEAGIEDTSSISSIDDLLKFTAGQSKLPSVVAKQEEALAVSETKLENIEQNVTKLQEAVQDMSPEQLRNSKITFDESGNISMTTGKTPQQLKMEKDAALEEFEAKETIKAGVGMEGKRRTAADIAFNNVTKVIGGSAELVTTYTDSLIEDGMGSLGAAVKTRIAEVIGGDFAINFDDSLTWKGIKTEIVSAMMPLLTQQGDKPGSVRLVATIFDKLEKTIPTTTTPGFVGRNQIRKTLINMGRRAMAASLLGATNETVTEDNQDEWSKRIRNLSGQIAFSKEQQRELNRMMKVTMGPLDEELANQVNGTLIYDADDNAVIVTPESIGEARRTGDMDKLDMIVNFSRRDKWGNLRGLTPEESKRIIKRRKAKRRRK